MAEAAVRTELAEDLTARALARCVPLLQGDGVPEHIRFWTSRAVLGVEADLISRFAARCGQPRHEAAQLEPLPRGVLRGLDSRQASMVAVLAGDRRLVVVQGAAGAGKTVTLAATRHLLERQGRRLVVVTPTLKAAKVARAEVGAAAGSAASLAFAYGWRWDEHSHWTRLAVGDQDLISGRAYTGPDERNRLRPGDLLVIDEAGMLDQDTARALLTVADECQARLALLGDSHQLAAVGRGGVLDLAAGAADPGACLTLESVHRFTRTDSTARTVPDREYAALTLAMRRGDNPGAVFDALHAGGRIRLHPDPGALQDALAATVADAGRVADIAVVADTREQVGELNAAIRSRLVADGRVDDTTVVITRAGQRIGAGDRITTRRNDRGLDVANRDTWTVTAVGRRGSVLVTPTSPPVGMPGGDVTPTGADVRVLPAGYVAEQVELAYASTVYGVQGETVSAAHVVIGDRTGAAAAYVGMTRGRAGNTAHLIAAELAEAREQWITVFGRNRADLGPGHAAELAAREAARYARSQPLDRPAPTPGWPAAPASGVPRPEAERRRPSSTRGGTTPGIRR